MNKLKRIFTVLIVLLMVVNYLRPLTVLAEEEGDSGEPEQQQVEEENTPSEEELVEVETVNTEEPDSGVQIENEAEVIDDVESTALTGENEIVSDGEELPTPSPAVSPSSSPEAECLEGCFDEGEIESVGEEEVVPSPTPGPPPAAIETGDAVSVTEVENSVNTTEVDSQVLFQTLNIFVSQDIDLTFSPLMIAERVINGDKKDDEVVNVVVLDVNNIAYVSNDLVSIADTGDNSIEGSGNAVINTGDAYSIVSLLNKVNTTIIGSTIHVVTINIFGGVQGNIILPEFTPDEECCTDSLEVDNNAYVENNIISEAVSGENTIELSGEGEASIESGEAMSVVNVINIVNASYIGTYFQKLYINTLGTWIGSFLGWGDSEAYEEDGMLTNFGGDCPGCVSDASIENEAYLVNNISSRSNTGGNSISGDGAMILTGNAYSSVSLINFVNTSIINSIGFFGFINIFGTFEGDIGGASQFEEPEVVNEDVVEEIQGDSKGAEEDTESIRESGGILEITQTNNVGTHVLPGDTITFFVNVKNSGTGRVYESKLRISLINEQGIDMGGGTFELGDIKAGESLGISTGLVLSKKAKSGKYIAHALVSGYIGPDNELITAFSDSEFLIAGGNSGVLAAGLVDGTGTSGLASSQVLGETIVSSAGLSTIEKIQITLFALLMMFIPLKGYQRREELAIALGQFKGYAGSKALSLRSILTSFFA